MKVEKNSPWLPRQSGNWQEGPLTVLPPSKDPERARGYGCGRNQGPIRRPWLRAPELE